MKTREVKSEAHGHSKLGFAVLAFTIGAMTIMGGIGGTILVGKVWNRAPYASAESDEEAMKLCLFSGRSLENCVKLIQLRRQMSVSSQESEVPSTSALEPSQADDHLTGPAEDAKDASRN